MRAYLSGYLLLLADVWALFSSIGMAALVIFTVAAWVLGAIDPRLLRPHPEVAPAPRRAFEERERIPATSLPVRPE